MPPVRLGRELLGGMDGKRPPYLLPQLAFLVAQPLAMRLGALAQQRRQYLGAAPRRLPFAAAPGDGARQHEGKVRHEDAFNAPPLSEPFQNLVTGAA